MNSRNISNEVKTKQMKSIGALENLKSNYFFQRILICLVKKKSLEIIKYNKKLQKIVIYLKRYLIIIWGLGIGDWGLGIGDWGLCPIPNPQSPIPNPQSPFISILNSNKI